MHHPLKGGALTQGNKIIGPYQPGLGDGYYWIPGNHSFLGAPASNAGATLVL